MVVVQRPAPITITESIISRSSYSYVLKPNLCTAIPNSNGLVFSTLCGCLHWVPNRIQSSQEEIPQQFWRYCRLFRYGPSHFCGIQVILLHPSLLLSSWVAPKIHLSIPLLCGSSRFGAVLLAFFFSSSTLTKFGEDRKRTVDPEFKEGGQRNW